MTSPLRRVLMLQRSVARTARWCSPMQAAARPLRPSVTAMCPPSRSYSDAAAAEEVSPLPSSGAVDPKIRAIVDDISKLTLIEVASLCTVLKEELNIADAAPVAIAGPAAAAVEEEAPEEDAGPQMVKVTLTAFADDKKVKLIKEVKATLSPHDPKFNLAGAKKFVESLPNTVREDISKEEGEKLKEALEKAGGTVTIE